LAPVVVLLCAGASLTWWAVQRADRKMRREVARNSPAQRTIKGGGALRAVASVMEAAAKAGDLRTVGARAADLEAQYERLREAMTTREDAET
jgi:hypothetical protein